ncbi:hypothetical protein [Mobilicoccus caccae]|uniref:Uncharacterized protein n=1 Tax=Mobilicoccus caccae TaxID=1859295 RepID=A0ABQ6IXN4_9MICO|nr:hypothetical protein [Mobilicoccus caccae]GMA41912.1 hypothetical protein GCM10025883_39570 [Mobilicoccus caccae]
MTDASDGREIDNEVAAQLDAADFNQERGDDPSAAPPDEMSRVIEEQAAQAADPLTGEPEDPESLTQGSTW